MRGGSPTPGGADPPRTGHQEKPPTHLGTIVFCVIGDNSSGATSGIARALSFEDGAHAYDADRPGYPQELLDDVLEFAGDGAAHEAPEVGAGTGKLTLPFARRGLRVAALEPVENVARVLRANADREGDWSLAAAANYVDGIREVYRRHGPDLTPDLARSGPSCWPADQTEATPRLVDSIERSYGCEWNLPAARYLRLLAASSLHAVLTARGPSHLFDALREVLRDHVLLLGETQLNLIRKAC